MDILFVVSPSNARSKFMPFYYLYLAGYLEKEGFKVGIVDPHEKRTEANVNVIMREIKEKKPRYVGLAAFVTDYDVILNLAKKIKQETGSKIIVGNAHPSVSPRDFLYENSPFDIVVRGEGELTLKQVLEEYDENKDNGHIKGIAYLFNGGVKINDNREFMDLSECGMPAYHMVDMKWNVRPTKLIIRRLIVSTAVIQTSRGCPYNCGFCASNTVWKAMAKAPAGPPLVRKRPMVRVMEELRILQDKYHFDFFYILDDTFGMTERDMAEFCDAYGKSGLRMLWAATTRVTCIKNEETVKMLKRAGCIQLDFGVESGSPKMLEIINKKINTSEVVSAFSLCRKHGIRTAASILLNLPEETEDDIVMSHKLLAQINPTFLSVGVTQPYPGTPFHDKYLKTPVPREHYSKLDRLNPPEEYRMSKHNLDFNTLLHRWEIKYGIYTPLETNIFKADRRYWMAVFRSCRKLAYLDFLLKELIMTPIVYVNFWLSILRSGKI